ncbi:hypothetical protein S40285_03001 [Stachybotrys chlorohalonatus IBT 40285]|uniref:Chromosome transmission fidelity protein 4 n=1 Tax=Stachybotrys chlorohalonatus (strain IBT 40285) TaxID=1283841 RepID=A0A084QSZ6_STAC4|nr:hypothetical protein S40285_03001 [Stachybotrys chlorohalonata IBT 40285]
MTTSMRCALRASRCSPAKQARRLAIFSPAKAQVQATTPPAAAHIPTSAPGEFASQQHVTGPKHGLPLTYFDATGSQWMGSGNEQPLDPNKAKLGKTLRILQERLPTLLQSPLPQEILAPNISLHLFPSTHPHLPTVSGRVAYNAALWTSPIAWNRVPIIGNVKLEILAERMTSEPLTFLPRRAGAMPEQLVVRWCERRKTPEDMKESGGIAKSLGLGRGVDPKKAFTGLFIFDFDREGRILTHTIEQTQEGGNWEKGVGAKFVELTDWLLGGLRDPRENPMPICESIRRTT